MMASECDPPVYSVDDLNDDDDDDLEDDNLVTVADLNHQLAIIPAVEKNSIDNSNRVMFQRLWNENDEIELLLGFLVHSSSHNPDNAAFYENIKTKLQLDFSKNQLVDKLRRLKKKYRTVMGKFNSGKDYVFKTAHDHALFDISKKIWFEPEKTQVIEDEEFNTEYNGGVDLNLKGYVRPKKRSKTVTYDEIPPFNQENVQVGVMPVGNSVTGLIEETVRSCLTPIFEELVKSVSSNSREFRGCEGIGAMSSMGFGLGNLSSLGYVFGADTGNMMDDKWRKQQLLELEVYSKRLELVQDQIKLRIDELTKSL